MCRPRRMPILGDMGNTRHAAWRNGAVVAAVIALWTGLPIAAVRARGEEPAPAANPADVTPPWGTFPKPGAGIELAGELVVVDHVNRRFGLRLDGDFNKYRYFNDAKLKATLLPYGEVWYHGAPADLADIPLGTRLQGRFLLPPKDAPPRQLPSDQEKAFPPPLHDRALVVEDGFSHERRRGRAFRIDKLEIKRVRALDVLKEAAASAEGDAAERFASDAMLMTGELSKLLAEVVDCLGGQPV